MISCLLVLLLLNCRGGCRSHRLCLRAAERFAPTRWKHKIATSSRSVENGFDSLQFKATYYVCFWVFFLRPRGNHVKPKRLTYKSYKITKNKDQDCYSICCRGLQFSLLFRSLTCLEWVYLCFAISIHHYKAQMSHSYSVTSKWRSKGILRLELCLSG